MALFQATIDPPFPPILLLLLPFFSLWLALLLLLYFSFPGFKRVFPSSSVRPLPIWKEHQAKHQKNAICSMHKSRAIIRSTISQFPAWQVCTIAKKE